MVGPEGFEPSTKGFTLPRSFPREWTISSPAPARARARVREALACHQGHSKPSGSLCTFRRCTAGSAQGCHGHAPEGFPEFFPSTSRVTARRHLVDESPALTAVLQAQRQDCSNWALRGCLGLSDGVERAAHPAAAAVQHMRVADDELAARDLEVLHPQPKTFHETKRPLPYCRPAISRSCPCSSRETGRPNGCTPSPFEGSGAVRGARRPGLFAAARSEKSAN
jgi:hypothetical protein